MANTLVGAELRQGSGFARKGEGFQLIFGEEWHFRVKTDQVTSDRLDVLYNTPGLPYAGLIYGQLNLVCEEVTCEREPLHRHYWNVTARFQTGSEQQQAEDQANPDPNPLTWYPIFTIDSFGTKERTLTADYSAVPKKPVNSAGTPFDTPLMTTSTFCQFSFVQFEDPITKLKTIMDRNDKINAGAFIYQGQTFDAKTLLCSVEGAELGSFAGNQAWRVKYKITYDPDTHDEKRLDYGPYYWDGVKWQVYMDFTKTFPIVGPLDGLGGKAGSNVAAVLTFQVKKSINFNFIRTK